MSTLESNRITVSGLAAYYSRTRALPETALSTADLDEDQTLWDEACERMLAWRSSLDQFEAEDAPDLAVLDTAIDFAIDERTSGGPAPSSIVPSGSGRIAFEWIAGDDTMIIEFVGCGRAEYTRITAGKVTQQGQLL